MEKNETNVTHVTLITSFQLAKRAKGFLQKKAPKKKKPAPKAFKKPRGTRKAVRKGYSTKEKKFFFKKSKDSPETKKSKKKFLKVFKTTFYNVAHTCSTIGIHRRTFYRWIKNDERFKNAVEAERNAAGEYVLAAIVNKAIIDKDTKSAIYYDQTHGVAAQARKQQTKSSHDYSEEVAKFVQSNSIIHDKNDVDDGLDSAGNA